MLYDKFRQIHSCQASVGVSKHYKFKPSHNTNVVTLVTTVHLYLSSILKLPAILNIHKFWKHLFAVIPIIEAKFFAPVWTTVDYFWNAN
jgi:hypothetical protein